MIAEGIATDVVIEIGELPIRFCTDDPSFHEMLTGSYAGFVRSGSRAQIHFDVELAPADAMIGTGDVTVEREPERWLIGRGDFEAQWSPRLGRGVIRQSANPYSFNTALRILHTILLAEQGGFLVHASSAVRNGRAFLFAGVSGAGKTTMARLAPPDVALLTDEISYVSRRGNTYLANGTPFAGDLGRIGENICAPLAAVYLLAKGTENKIEPVNAAEAGRALLENILFFARDSELVRSVFEAACDFVSRVPVQRLTFAPDARVWEMIG
ncbi:MAG TPA: hypothetical protein VMI32_00055 [Candidatus Solibacter sp.]|nr:hypothetical protein [Candidatus Solibacter sp.]